MMPMGGMGGGAGDDEGRKKKSWLEEADDVWGANEDKVAPPVLGGPAPGSGRSDNAGDTGSGQRRPGSGGRKS